MTGVRPLYLHIGLQKTGTSYLQSIFWQNLPELAAQGLDLVPGSKRATFNLLLRIRDRFDPTTASPAITEALERLPAQLAAAPGDRALLTEESIGSANDDQVARLVAACGDREIHVVMTLRDLGRQIPSAWQQMAQSGGVMSWVEYLDRMREVEGQSQARVWNSKDVGAILKRWSKHVPAERIHLITVPPAGGDPEVLLHRYCEVLGIDWRVLDREVARSNKGIGLVQAELLRRINAVLPEADHEREVYGEVAKRWFAGTVLGPQDGDRIRIPAAYADWVRGVSDRYSDAIRAGGYPVTGDLADLDPADDAFTAEGFEVTDADVLDSAVDALAAVLGVRMDEVRARRAEPAPAPAPMRRKGKVRRLLAGS